MEYGVLCSMGKRNIRCKRNCGNSIKEDLVEDHEHWKQTDDGWLCPTCNPDGPDW